MYLARLLLAIWFFAVLGTTAELLLLEHFDGVLQLIPLILLSVGLVVGAWYAVRPTAMSLQAFRALLPVYALAGGVGLYLHYRGNAEFEKEQDASVVGAQLVWNALTGATPALAPGTMALLALIGYAVTIARGTPPFRGAGPEAH